MTDQRPHQRENDLADEQVFAMWDEAEPIELVEAPDGQPVRVVRSTPHTSAQGETHVHIRQSVAMVGWASAATMPTPDPSASAWNREPVG